MIKFYTISNIIINQFSYYFLSIPLICLNKLVMIIKLKRIGNSIQNLSGDIWKLASMLEFNFLPSWDSGLRHDFLFIKEIISNQIR